MNEAEQAAAEKMWRSYPQYKRPIIPSDFIDAFTSRVRALQYESVRINGKLDPADGDFDCRVSVTKKVAFVSTARAGQFYDSHICNFQLTHLRGCGGVLVSHNSWVQHGEQGRGLGTLMQEMKMWIARLLEVGQLLATVVVGNKVEEGMLEKHGWVKVGQPFRNAHTENTVQMWQRILI